MQSKGPDLELYLAEEAIGLAKSLYWTVKELFLILICYFLRKIIIINMKTI
jgi:hypothetical protein